MAHIERNRTRKGALLMLVGLFLLLGNLGWLDIDLDTIFGLAFAGFWAWIAQRLIQGANRQDQALYFMRLGLAGFFGLISISTLAAALLSDTVDMGWVWSLFWPGIFIASGLYLIMRGRRALEPGYELAASRSVLLGKAVYGRSESILGRSQVNVGIGDVALDLTHGELPLGETVMDVALGIGDVEVLVPRELPVALEAHGGMLNINFLGRQRDLFLSNHFDATDGYDTAAQKVRIVVHAGIGDLDVIRLG
jgi:predicted membrane protein